MKAGKKLIVVVLLVVCSVSVYAVRWYHGFYHHVTHEELSHEVKHSVLPATIRSGKPLHLQLYQQENAANQPVVIFTSGDGGWSPFCADIAAHIATDSITVVGIDAKEYMTTFATPQHPLAPEEVTHDYDTIARLSTAHAGIDSKAPITLAGWSLGASYSVLVASQPQFTFPVSRVVAISLPVYGELAWRPTDAIIYVTHRRPNEKTFETLDYLKNLNQTPIVFLNATNDDTSPFNEAQSLYEAAKCSKHFYAVKASGHHFEGGEKEFYHDLDLGLSIPQIADKTDNKVKEKPKAAG